MDVYTLCENEILTKIRRIFDFSYYHTISDFAYFQPIDTIFLIVDIYIY